MARKHLGGHVDLRPASLTVGAPTLTVGQIAELLRLLAPDKAASAERIRHWTRESLITPVEKHHEGTGKHRGYDPGVVYDAAVLIVIADAGLHIAGHRYLLDALSQVRRVSQKWKLAKSGGLYFEIAYAKDSAPIFKIHEGSVKPHPKARLSIVLNLAEIFKKVEQARAMLRDRKAKVFV